MKRYEVSFTYHGVACYTVQAEDSASAHRLASVRFTGGGTVIHRIESEKREEDIDSANIVELWNETVPRSAEARREDLGELSEKEKRGEL